jgi:hypothetical protein
MEHLAQTDTMEHQYESGPENDNEEKPLLGTDHACALSSTLISVKGTASKEMRFNSVELTSLIFTKLGKLLIVLHFSLICN